MNYDIAFLTTMYPEKTAYFYGENGFLQDSENITFIQDALIEGFEKRENVSVHVINKLLVHRQPTPRIPECFWKHSEKCMRPDVSFSYVNKPVFSSNLLFHYAKPYVKKWLSDGKKDSTKILIVYALTNYALEAINYVKRHNSNVITAIIVPDLPNHTKRSKGSLLRSVKNKVSNWITDAKYKKYSSLVDMFFVFSRHMVGPLNCENRYCVIEGIATDFFDSVKIKRQEDDDAIVVLYAGGLHRKYGIKLLVDAFEMIDDSNFRLYLCGWGDYLPNIVEIAKRDSRVKYLGCVSRKSLLEFEKGANILVNPRTDQQEFSKYSFPSKNMEYLSSGVPFIAFKLGGIPDEYDDYINYPAAETARALSDLIKEVGLSENEGYGQKAQRAKQFVLEEKNKYAQTEKMVRALENVSRRSR